MRMFLTRLGFGARAVVTGRRDAGRPARGRAQRPGRRARLLDGVEGIAMCEFTGDDVVRHPLVQRIVVAYERGIRSSRSSEAEEKERERRERIRPNERLGRESAATARADRARPGRS
jgi:phosphate starvation-inducible PhoH-like protein